MSQMVDIGNLVFAAQMARDSVSLDKGLQKLNNLAESSGLEEIKARYEEIKTDMSKHVLRNSCQRSRLRRTR